MKIKLALALRCKETKSMLQTYKKTTQGTASKDEITLANRQLADLLKELGIGVFAILPFAPLTIPAIVMLGRRFNINVLPSSFYRSTPDSKDY
ncbi:MAG: hypothetical protein QS721_08530 [Candidatus Endonucleobacter sp. (ex Gigantidas childressi)]|nr:hypothetical protein [Candidatus Endonucleobacter sp. (ex Gigantidas childressi)]